MMAESLDPKQTRQKAVKVQLDEMEKALREQGVVLTRAEIARRVGKAPSAVSNWFKWPNGQMPREAQLASLAQVLSLDERTALDYRERLFQAAGIDEPPLTPWERAKKGQQIRIAVVEYDPAVDGFFMQVASAFGQFCGFLASPQIVKFDGLTQEIDKGKFDLAFGLWETPKRLLSLRFLATPIEMGMNMLGLGATVGHIEVHSGLAELRQMRPIMNEGQASYRLAMDVLGFDERRIVSCDYAPTEFQKKLLEGFDEWHRDKSAGIPVLITDELMCWKVYNGILNQISASPEKREKLGLPVLWLADADRRWARDGKLVAAHPRYNVSVCTKRAPTDPWFDFIEDAWRIFIRGNRGFLTDKYAELFLKLKRHLDETDDLTACPGGKPSKEAKRWAAVYADWLFDHQLRDFHDEQTWKTITDPIRDHAELKAIGERFEISFGASKS